MKKSCLGSLVFLFAFLPFVVQVESEAATDSDEMSTCVAVLQPAVGLQGQCKVFPNPCTVPDDWKKVSSCKAVRAQKVGKSLEERRKIRTLEYLRRKRHKAGGEEAGLSNRTSKNYKFRGTIKPRKKRVRQEIKRGVRRASTQKNSYLRKKYQTRNEGTILDNSETSEKVERRVKKRKIRSSVSKNRRRGKLSNAVKASTLIKLRSQRNTGEKKDWYNTYISEKRKLRKSKRKPYVYKRPSLRKTFKGERLYGDLENATNRSASNETSSE